MEECFPVKVDDLWFEEGVEDYRSYSLAADSIVKAAAWVNAGEVPPDKVFRQFAYWNRPRPWFALGKRLGFPRHVSARLQIADEVNDWIALSQAHPRLGWNAKARTWTQTMARSPRGVLGAIALALFTSVPQEGGWLKCSICPDVFRADRPRADGRNKYCPECRNSPKMWAFLKRQQRAEKRKEQ